MPDIVTANDNDEVIGSAKRVEKYSLGAGVYYRMSVLWVVNDKGQVLLAKRAATKDSNPDKWGPSAAGTVEVGETYESNVYKEAEEEIGLTGFEFAELYTSKGYKGIAKLFAVRCNWPIEKFTKQDEEVAALKWADLTELQKDAAANPDKYVNNFAESMKDLSKMSKRFSSISVSKQKSHYFG
jgi:isopentenyldiphosphate isomerase